MTRISHLSRFAPLSPMSFSEIICPLTEAAWDQIREHDQLPRENNMKLYRNVECRITLRDATGVANWGHIIIISMRKMGLGVCIGSSAKRVRRHSYYLLTRLDQIEHLYSRIVRVFPHRDAVTQWARGNTNTVRMICNRDVAILIEDNMTSWLIKYSLKKKKKLSIRYQVDMYQYPGCEIYKSMM